MNLTHLNSFLMVAQEGSLTAAAARLFITQPAVSQHIKALEEELNSTLFIRHKKGMLLTTEGKELRLACEKIIRVANDIPFQVQQVKQLKRGKLTISLSASLYSALVPTILLFKSTYPRVCVSLVFNNTQEVLEHIKNYQADIGFATSASPLPATIKTKRIHQERLILLARAEHPLSQKKNIVPADLISHLFVMREEGTATGQFIKRWFKKTDLPQNIIITTRASSVRELILEGAIGMLPENSISGDIRVGRIVELAADNMNTMMDFNIYISSTLQLSNAAKAFINCLSQTQNLSLAANLCSWLDIQK